MGSKTRLISCLALFRTANSIERCGGGMPPLGITMFRLECEQDRMNRGNGKQCLQFHVPFLLPVDNLNGVLSQPTVRTHRFLSDDATPGHRSAACSVHVTTPTRPNQCRANPRRGEASVLINQLLGTSYLS